MDRFDQTHDMDANWSMSSIQHGWDVFDADGDKVGDVKDVNQDYLTVSKGFFFPSERYIPTADIRGTSHDRVYLSVTKDELEREGWDQPPTTSGGRVYQELDREFDRDRTTTGTTGTGRVADMTDRTTPERELELTKERLVPHEERVKAGEVNLHTDVVEQEKTVDVPLTHEEVVVERRPVEGRPADAPDFQEQDIRVPVYEEQVQLEKEPVVYEEVNVETRPVTETKKVTDTVKKEVLDVDTQGNVDVSKRDNRRPPTEAELRDAGDTDLPRQR